MQKLCTIGSKVIPALNVRPLLVLAAVMLLILAAACQPLAMPEGGEATGDDEQTMAEGEEEMAEGEDEMAEDEEEMAEGEEEMAGIPEAGAYVIATVSGCGCHFNGDLGGLAGGNEFEGPWGVVYTPNLTPHETGVIADMTDEALADALRLGKYHEGGNLAPPMPRFTAMADEDVTNLIAYLRSLDPIENEVPERQITGEIPDTVVEQEPPATSPTDPVGRGQYIATLNGCGNCHTPRNEDRSLDWSRPLAGAPFRDTVAPNLTPDELTGLGGWSEAEIAEFMQTGIYSDGTEAHGGMKSRIDRGLNQLTDEDALAIAAFLKSLPPIDNLPQASE